MTFISNRKFKTAIKEMQKMVERISESHFKEQRDKQRSKRDRTKLRKNKSSEIKTNPQKDKTKKQHHQKYPKGRY